MIIFNDEERAEIVEEELEQEGIIEELAKNHETIDSQQDSIECVESDEDEKDDKTAKREKLKKILVAQLYGLRSELSEILERYSSNTNAKITSFIEMFNTSEEVQGQETPGIETKKLKAIVKRLMT
jgi:transposase-like protein